MMEAWDGGVRSDHLLLVEDSLLYLAILRKIPRKLTQLQSYSKASVNLKTIRKLFITSSYTFT
jgi:hypothetical protein